MKTNGKQEEATEEKEKTCGRVEGKEERLIYHERKTRGRQVQR